MSANSLLTVGFGSFSSQLLVSKATKIATITKDYENFKEVG